MVTAGWCHKTLGSATALRHINYWFRHQNPLQKVCNEALDVHFRDVLVTNFMRSGEMGDGSRVACGNKAKESITLL